MPVRGIRGATTATANTREAILEATRERLELIIEANDVDPDRNEPLEHRLLGLDSLLAGIGVRDECSPEVGRFLCGHLDVAADVQVEAVGLDLVERHQTNVRTATSVRTRR